jgi:hypothetical protein
MESKSENVICDDEGKVIYEFKGEEVRTLTEEEERKINALVGAHGAICMDAKTIITPSKEIDYGVCRDIAGNVIENLPQSTKNFVRNSIFH